MTKFGKRLDGPGGRRTAPRAPVLMSAAMHAVSGSQTVSLLDVSKTGAKLRARMPLTLDQHVWIKIPPDDVFGTVVWAEGEEYGIHFDTPLTDADAASLQARGKVVIMPRLTLEEQLGVEDWKSGFIR
jgi:hypothetical protein